MTDHSPALLNDALCAYVHTISDKNRLVRHLAERGQIRSTRAINRELDAILHTADDLLWQHPHGIEWTTAFLGEYFAQLREKHPWLDAQGFECVLGYSRWLCWHEGMEPAAS